MKLSMGIKISYVMSVVLSIVGFYLSSDVMVATAVIIFVVISCTVEILEAIEAKKEPNDDI
tara:strand:- start:503 stop:685 length:183 start_codon:yes stop_codon:yes gene_type:complete